VKVTLRADSGFCRWRLIRWCDHHSVGYVLGLARNAVLKELAGELMEEAEQQSACTGDKIRRFGEVCYAAQTWDRSRRVVVEAERLAGGPNEWFVATNLAGDLQALYDDLYCARIAAALAPG